MDWVSFIVPAGSVLVTRKCVTQSEIVEMAQTRGIVVSLDNEMMFNLDFINIHPRWKCGRIGLPKQYLFQAQGVKVFS